MINRVECHHGTYCLYVNGRDVLRLLGERDYLSQRIDEMEKVMAQTQAETEKLRQENQRLKEEKEKLGYQLKQMLGKIFKSRVKPDPEVNRSKRGAPCGHRDNSRRRPEEVSEFIDLYPDKRDQCGG
jgi:FtsZ-binding cell division protein ZapB